MPVLKAQLETAKAQLAQAEANLSRTIITAPVAGRVTQLTAAKGGYAAVGQALMMFVPREVWVTANFKETQLDLMRPGQPVDIEIDAYPDRTFKGHVDSIQVRQRHRVQPVAGGKRDRQLRQDRAARAGQDRVRQAARRAARARHVGRADGESAMSDQSRSRGWDSSRSAAGDRNPWLVAVVVSIATFMVVLDTAIANVSLRYIAGSLAASVDESTWVVTTYLIANAVVLPASGWLSNVVGRKRFYMICVALFTVSSLFCGLAPSLGALIFFRILQGLGGGGMPTSEQAILADTFPPQRRGQAFALYGVAVIVAPTVGPTVGGWITDNFSWHWIFFINVPIGLGFAGAGALARRRTRSARTRARRASGRRTEGRLGRLRADRGDARLSRSRARPRPDRRLVPIRHDRHVHDARRRLVSRLHSVGAQPGRSDRRNSAVCFTANSAWRFSRC